MVSLLLKSSCIWKIQAIKLHVLLYTFIIEGILSFSNFVHMFGWLYLGAKFSQALHYISHVYHIFCSFLFY